MQKPDRILETLQRAGYAAYFVGGCVRDTLLERPVHDWDICTSARPEQTMQVFPHCVPTGLRHGTVTVLEDGESFEVTTFRSEGAYLDNRHPSEVSFVADLREDLSRRDFTVNAMAMDLQGRITDLFGGREDLSSRILRCVGDPGTRFREDALRMLRALRFSAQLDFTVEARTAEAIRTCAPLCAGLSAERVREELEKTLLSDAPFMAQTMAELGLLCAVGIGGCGDLSRAALLPKEPDVRWAAFFRACPEADWQKLRMERQTGQTAQTAAELSNPGRTRREWKTLIARKGRRTALCTAELTGEAAFVREILTSGECITLTELAVSGSDFPTLEGREVGRVLSLLLEKVHADPDSNTREKLLSEARKMIEKK